MKIVTRPAQAEQAVCSSDFSGKRFAHNIPPVTITIECNYGSRYDGGRARVDLGDEEADQVISFISKRLCPKSLGRFRDELRKAERDLDDSVQARDWVSAEGGYCRLELLRKIVQSGSGRGSRK
jgi:hypothetical protein